MSWLKCSTSKIHKILLKTLPIGLLFGFFLVLLPYFYLYRIKDKNSTNDYVLIMKNKLIATIPNNNQFQIYENYSDYNNLRLFICLNNIENSMSDNRSKEICNEIISNYKKLHKEEKQEFEQMNSHELKQREIDKKYNLNVE